jgi:hypothetical protein
MKIGTAKENGAHRGKFIPLERSDGFALIKGHKYQVPDDYRGDLFEFEETKKKKEK